MKARWIRTGILLGASMLSSSIIARPPVMARSSSSTADRRQQALVKRINQRALRFYKAFIRQSITTTTVDCELNDLLEDLLLAADSLTDPRYLRHNLVIVMQIASDIEQELLAMNISSDLVIAWGRLHADLDRLAKMNGIKWSEAVITDQLIASSVVSRNSLYRDDHHNKSTLTGRKPRARP